MEKAKSEELRIANCELRMKTRRLAIAGFALVSCLPAQAQPARISNARLRTENAAADLGVTINTLLSHKAEPFWVAWDVPMVGRRHACCFGSMEDADRSPCGGRCYLESENRNSGFFDSDGSDCAERNENRRLLIFARLEAGEIRRLRTFSEDCAIDAEGRTLVWLTGARPSQSIAFLEKLAVDPPLDSKKRKHSSERALSAIAMHDDPAADAVLERFAAPGAKEELRMQAAFWLGNARGRRGYEVLRRLAQVEPSQELRRHVTFALSQSPEPQALDTLISMAKSDRSSSVRGQALFWLAQKAGRKAAGVIRDAIDDDPETEVKRQAVFALSQLPREEGIPQLIRVARTNRNPEVRKQAIFWLGQSNDSRALEFIEEILK
jgi:HEAT repeat protein